MRAHLDKLESRRELDDAYRCLVGPIGLMCLVTGPGCMVGPDFLLHNAYHGTIERVAAPKVVKRWLVLDAQSKMPLVGADVVVAYDFGWEDAWTFHGTTDSSGIAMIKMPR